MKSTREVVWSGKLFEVIKEHVQTPEGVRTFEMVARPDGARVIAFDGAKLLLTREFRHELQHYDWRLPGGRQDSSDADIEHTAKREFLEETGYVADEWRYLWASTPSSSVRYQRHFFVARGLTYQGQHTEVTEDIDVGWFTLAEACEMALNGDISEEISALTLLKLQQKGSF